MKKVRSSFKDNIWGAELADMRLISKYNKCVRFLFVVLHLIFMDCFFKRKNRYCTVFLETIQPAD